MTKTCPGCGEEVDRLVLHHYRDAEQRLCTWRICDLCNSILNPHELCSSEAEMLVLLKEYYGSVSASRDELMATQLERWREGHAQIKRVREWLRGRSDVSEIEKAFYALQRDVTDLLPLRREAPALANVLAEPFISVRQKLEEKLGLVEGDPTFVEISQYFVHKRHQREHDRLPEVRKRRAAYGRKRYAEQKAVRMYIREHPEALKEVLKWSRLVSRA